MNRIFVGLHEDLWQWVGDAHICCGFAQDLQFGCFQFWKQCEPVRSQSHLHSYGGIHRFGRYSSWKATGTMCDRLDAKYIFFKEMFAID